MPTDLQSDRRHRTRDAIVAAAWELAHEQGIAELSLRDLAARVGMRAPSLYSHFASKAAIYDAMFAEGYRELDERADAWPLHEGDRGDRLGTLLVGWLEFCLESVPRYQLLYTRVIPGWEPSPEAYASSLASYERFAGVMADIGVSDPAHLDLWTALASGLAAQQVANEPTGRRWVALAHEATAMFLDHVDRTRSRP